MTNRVTFNSIIGLAIMLSLLAVAPAPTFAACRNAGGSSGSTKFSSQVNGGSVAICASAVAVTPARSATVKAVVKIAPRVTVKSVTNPKAGFHRLPAPVAVVKVKVKAVPKLPLKQKVVTKVISKLGTTNKTSTAANFTPAAVNGNVYPSNELFLGQQASFVSTAVQHYRAGTLLGLPTEVRFTPISVSWNFGDGSGGAGSYSAHAFSATGLHQVQVRVVYAVSYRVKGRAAWIAEPDSITVADDLMVQVSAGASAPSAPVDPSGNSRVLLVGQDCLSNPGSFGCN